MLQKSGRLVLWEAMFILELHSAETQESVFEIYRTKSTVCVLFFLNRKIIMLL